MFSYIGQLKKYIIHKRTDSNYKKKPVKQTKLTTGLPMITLEVQNKQ